MSAPKKYDIASDRAAALWFALRNTSVLISAWLSSQLRVTLNNHLYVSRLQGDASPDAVIDSGGNLFATRRRKRERTLRVGYLDVENTVGFLLDLHKAPRSSKLAQKVNMPGGQAKPPTSRPTVLSRDGEKTSSRRITLTRSNAGKASPF